jgi:hypothetical protein
MRTVPAATALLLASLALATLGCKVEPIDLPPPQGWHSYENATLGVALDVPDFFEVREYGGGAMFRLHGANAVLLRFVDEAEARQRGLWVGTPPAGPISLGGRAGEHYVYRHGDGPVYSVTEAYVICYRGKQLGLEFRTRKDAGVRQRMLSSFRLLGG